MASQKSSKKSFSCYLCKNIIPLLQNVYEVSKDATVSVALAQIVGTSVTNEHKYLCTGCYNKCVQFGETLVKAKEMKEALLRQITSNSQDGSETNDSLVEMVYEDEETYGLEEERYMTDENQTMPQDENDDDEPGFVFVREEIDEHGNTIVTEIDENEADQMGDEMLNLLSEDNMLEIVKDNHQASEDYKAIEEADVDIGGQEDENCEFDGQELTTEEADPAFLFVDGAYVCQLCIVDGDEVKLDQLKKFNKNTIATHLRVVHSLRVFICEFCSSFFTDRPSYETHMENHDKSDDESIIQCRICQHTFKDIKTFRIHRRTHNVAKMWSCDECPRKFSSFNLLEEHKNMHTGKRPYKCSECSKDFASKYTLTAHMKIHTHRARPYQCKLCDKSFYSNQNLGQHERTHNGDKSFKCPICDKSFATQHNVDVHRVTHSGYKPFICRICSKPFARRAEIRDHERTHTGERPFACDLCDSKFSQRSNLMSHKRATHLNAKPYKCEQCERCFKRRRLLDYHIKSSHTGERPYKCTICESTFIYPEHFKKHMRIHTGIKPYQCEVCGKPFNSRDNRNTHRFTHTDKKPFECIVCGMGFMRKPMLHAHMVSADHQSDTIIINQPSILQDGRKKNAGEEEEAPESAPDSEEQSSNVKSKKVYFFLESMKTESEEEDMKLGEVNEDDIIFNNEDTDKNCEIVTEDYIVTGEDQEIYITNDDFVEENAVIEEATDSQFVYDVDGNGSVEWIVHT